MLPKFIQYTYSFELYEFIVKVMRMPFYLTLELIQTRYS